ncbi:KilA-N domain-containing protein [Vibrio vulnificus]|uniref:KilA-N domain-containing protein n=1 Tax=Vibrio vulnificus TaxID=672 RepID=UPI0021D7E3F2|nr:KilA-N domain-containing protein [Vibrio vulnificus]
MTQSIIINGIEIKPTEGGMFCLNDIAKAGGLTDRKANPTEWRTKVSAHLERTQNLRSLNLGRNGSKTYGTEQAAIAYAMWVSIDFYMLVVEVFCKVRNDLALSKAVGRKLQRDNHELRHEAGKTKRQADQLKVTQRQLLASALSANSRLQSLERKQLLTFSDFCAYYGVSQKKLKQFWATKGLLSLLWNREGYKATDKGLAAGLVNQPSKFGTTQLRISRQLFDRYQNKDRLEFLLNQLKGL